MKLLIIGEADQFFVLSAVDAIRASYPDIIVDVVSCKKLRMQEKRVKSTYRNIYYPEDFEGAKKYGSHLLNAFSSIKYEASKLFEKESYDITHFHFMHRAYFPRMLFYPKQSMGRIYCSIWGSDYNNCTASSWRWRRWILKVRADRIFLTSEGLLEEFKNENSQLAERSSILKFGLVILEILSSMKKNRAECKELLNLSDGRKTIVVGYSSHRGQRLIELIDLLETLDDDVLSRCNFVFPMTYGDDMYRREVQDYLAHTRLYYHILKDFLDDDAMAQLRTATDGYLHLRTNDQISGSLTENLYCSNPTICGSWFPYDELKDDGIYYREIDSIEELPIIFPDWLESLDDERSHSLANCDLIWRRFSWEARVEDWKKAYEI